MAGMTTSLVSSKHLCVPSTWHLRLSSLASQASSACVVYVSFSGVLFLLPGHARLWDSRQAYLSWRGGSECESSPPHKRFDETYQWVSPTDWMQVTSERAGSTALATTGATQVSSVSLYVFYIQHRVVARVSFAKPHKRTSPKSDEGVETSLTVTSRPSWASSTRP